MTALLEGAAGLALLAWPSLPISLLLGAPLDAPSGVAVARVAGAALASLGLGCWLARNDGHARAVIAAMLLYNVATVAVLIHARLGLGLTGVGLWPAVGLHAVMATWCLACLRRQRESVARADP